MKGSKNTFMIIFGILLTIVGILIIYFNISYSPIRNNFENDYKLLIERSAGKKEYFKIEDFEYFPLPIQKYIANNGFLGKEKMDYAYMEYSDVDFAQSPEKRIKINYSQYNFTNKANRIAMIKSSIFGIPFEGYDYYINGQGGMKGILAKMVTLFYEKGKEMDKGALCTYLSECLFIPSSIIYNDRISFEEIDPYNVRASIDDNGTSVSGIFSFNENYEITRFYTEDRPAVKDDGSIDYVPWSANILSYKKYKDGINMASHVQIIWHYPKEDFLYFDGHVDKLIYKSELPA